MPILSDYIEVFEELVEAMKTSGNILSIDELADGVYDVEVDDITDIRKLGYITISGTNNFDGDHKIGDVTGNTFQITTTSGYAIENAGEFVTKYPYAMYGHLKEIIQTLAENGDGAALKYQRYPVVILALDVTEVKEGLPYNSELEGFNIIIANVTDRNYKSSDRRTYNFIPILHPLYEKFMEALIDSSSVVGTNLKAFPHKKTDRYFWGTVDNGNVLDDYVDAVQISDLRPKIKTTVINCN